MATLEDLEARVAALEASHADYRAVLAAVNALGANQRELATTVREHGRRLDSLETTVADFRHETRANFRSVDEQLTEIKDLILGRRNGAP
ncbi:hypothetical protein [Mycobacterium hubeiense]|uniref:hypothetical protein n=1 Tax=Mycobacterium hubeiense TaxID=1867256 RepID=UPI000C7F6553|nr:hypothetical protein [Mycobacterium sp. QGD 101]